MIHRANLHLIVFCAIAAALCGTARGQSQVKLTAHDEREQAVNKARTNLPLIDHGGPVLTASKTWAIYWGNASNFPSDLQSGMTSLLSGFNGSSYLGIAQQYMRGSGISTFYAGAVSDSSAPPSRSPSTSVIAAEVVKLFPMPEANALYIVFTSNAPNINYCAWHDKASHNGVTFQVAYVPNQAQLLSGCSPYLKTNLACNTLSEATVASADSVAHEFMEAVTDPQINAWYDKRGAEIGDKCNFVYNNCVNLANGTAWQIQSEWSNAIAGCRQQ
jgi:hypothetical protein